jgi:hypothetical protein
MSGSKGGSKNIKMEDSTSPKVNGNASVVVEARNANNGC